MPIPEPTTIAEVIRFHIVKNGISISEACRRSELARGTLAQWLNGARVPSIHALLKLCIGLYGEHDYQRAYLDISHIIADEVEKRLGGSGQ